MYAMNTFMMNFLRYGKGGSRHKNCCMARVLSYLIRNFNNYYTLHRSDLAARAAPLDPRLYGVMTLSPSAKSNIGSSLPDLPLYRTLIFKLLKLLIISKKKGHN